MKRYPTFPDITKMGYSDEEARNVLAMIEHEGGDPAIIWQSLRMGLDKGGPRLHIVY